MSHNGWYPKHEVITLNSARNKIYQGTEYRSEYRVCTGHFEKRRQKSF